jgi:SAM-dependent methyltransferase
VEPESVDLVYGVNVLHVARNLGASLAEAFDALAPGGWLVAGECLRPRPGQPLAAELPFLLFEGFRSVETDPELRPRPGFLTPELWIANLERAGFEPIQVVPDVRVLRDYYPNVTTGAVCGRKP